MEIKENRITEILQVLSKRHSYDDLNDYLNEDRNHGIAQEKFKALNDCIAKGWINIDKSGKYSLQPEGMNQVRFRLPAQNPSTQNTIMDVTKNKSWFMNFWLQNSGSFIVGLIIAVIGLILGMVAHHYGKL